MYDFTKERRPCARPNKGFAQQLMYFEEVVKEYHNQKGYCKAGGMQWKVDNKQDQFQR